MCLKAHLTSHSKMSGSRWVIIPLWLSESLRPFLYSSSIYSCHLFLISSASVRSLLFLPFVVPIFVWNIPLVSLIFLKRSLVFSNLFSSISLNCSLNKVFLSLLAILWHSVIRWVYLSLSPLSAVTYGCESWTIGRLSAKKLMLSYCGVGEVSWESLGQQGYKPVNPKLNQPWIFIARTDAETPILWPLDAKSQFFGKEPWCWERLMAKEERGSRGWDG